MARLPAGYSRRADGRVMARFTVDGTRYSVYGETVAECREKELQARRQIEERTYTRNRNISFQKYFYEWIERKTGTIKGNTIHNYKQLYKMIEQEPFTAQKVSEIERRQIIELQKKLSGKYHTNTVNHIFLMIKMILKMAVEDEIILKNPASGVKRLRRTEPETRDTIHRALTQEETEAFFKYAKGEWFYDLFRFLLWTGCRCGEAAALEWRDIDRKRGLLKINRTITHDENGKQTTGTPKTKTSEREIPLTESVLEILETQKKRQRDFFGNKVLAVNQRVFTGERGSSAAASEINNAIKRVIGKAAEGGVAIDPFTAHAFRGTFATRAIEGGMKPNTLKTILGHSTLAMTMDLYAHVMPDTKKEEMEKINIAI
ncbi:MAG: tyrosine-type recombinase/integrase [Eubacteriales bacterium]|nr:tyrosine-type recombinase/integrase [Eubacteriales bacterium]